MSTIPEDLYFTKTHEWLRENADGSLTIGISDHAQQALGDLVFVELAETEKTVVREEASCVVESVKAASDVYSPLAGEIVAANAALEEAPELVNTDPYGDGWLFQLKPTAEIDFDLLLDAGSYRDFLAAEE